MSVLLETTTVKNLLETPVVKYGTTQLDEARKSESFLARTAANAVDLSFSWTNWAIEKTVAEKTIQSVDEKLTAIATGSAQKIRSVSAALDHNKLLDIVDEYLDATVPLPAEESAEQTSESGEQKKQEEVPAQPLHDASLLQRTQTTAKKAVALGERLSVTTKNAVVLHKDMTLKYLDTRKTHLQSYLDAQHLLTLPKTMLDTYVSKEHLALAASLLLLSHDKLMQLTVLSHPKAAQKVTALLPETVTSTATETQTKVVSFLRSYASVEESEEEKTQEEEEVKAVLNEIAAKEEEEKIEEEEVFLPIQPLDDTLEEASDLEIKPVNQTLDSEEE